MFLKQARALHGWALLNRGKVGYDAADVLAANTPEQLAEQALELVPNQVKYIFAREGPIDLKDLKKLISLYPPTTMEGNYLIVAYPENSSFFALYGGMSQMLGGTLARCTEQHASKSYRADPKREHKLLYKVIDTPEQPTLNIGALGLLNGTDLDRDILYFYEACWVSLFGLYDEGKAHEQEILDLPHYGAVQFAGHMHPTNESCPLTERTIRRGGQRNSGQSNSGQRTGGQQNSGRSYIKTRTPANRICSECDTARDEYVLYLNHPTEQGLFICPACYQYWKKNGHFVRRLNRFPDDHDGQCEKDGCSERLLPFHRACKSGRWYCRYHGERS